MWFLEGLDGSSAVGGVWCVVGGWALSAAAEACVLTMCGRGWANSNIVCCCPGLCSQLRLQCNSMRCQTGYCALHCCGHADSACLVFPHLYYRRRTTLSPLGHSVYVAFLMPACMVRMLVCSTTLSMGCGGQMGQSYLDSNVVHAGAGFVPLLLRRAPVLAGSVTTSSHSP